MGRRRGPSGPTSFVGSGKDNQKKSRPHDNEDSSRADRMDSGRKQRSDKEIKNGRGLKDVLGLGSNSTGSSSSQKWKANSSPSFSSNETRSPGRRVEYRAVMSFDTSKPGDSRKPQAEAPAQRNFRANEPVYKPPGPVRNTSPSQEFKPVNKKSNSPVDPGWPRDRAVGTGLNQSIRPKASDGQPARTAVRKEGHRLWVTGMIKRHPDGFGFLIPDDPTISDVYISRQYMSGVMGNDRVEVEVFRAKPEDRSGTGERLFGEVKRIISRAHTRVVGRYLPVDRRYGVIQDDGRGWGMDLRIQAEDSQGAKEGDWIAVEITDYASRDNPLRGRVIKILGDVEDPLNDVIRVVHEKGIPDEFSFKAKHEAASLGTTVLERDKVAREDLRKIPLITIDGSTARDFDDAVFVENHERGFRLVVAIADVSHYVKPGSSIDEDAYSRGTSTYFPNFVVPMLPEELSNELCSLKPLVDRLCFACEMELDFQGVIQSYRFFEGVMCSQARVTYGQAQEVLDGNPGDDLKQNTTVCEVIQRCGDLAKILMAKRFREGSLDLDVPETQVVVDGSGETIDVVRTQRLFAHRLIEELMLVTNICTARFFEDNRIHGIYRIHEEPDVEKIKVLERMMWNILGPNSPGSKALSKDTGRGGLQKKLTKALQAAAGHPAGTVLNTLALRAMSQAKYSAQNLGHFGLGFQFYSHFTSPIRRYPDLIAHRLIKAVIYDRYANQGMEIEELDTATSHLSACEQRSVKAERQVVSIKKARFIRRYLGESLVGNITSVAKFGIFVTLKDFDVDGLVKLESLGHDRWVYDELTMRLYGRGTGRIFKLGDEVTIKVFEADLATGKIEFGLLESETEVEEALVVLDEDLPGLMEDDEFSNDEGGHVEHGKEKPRVGNKRDRPNRKSSFKKAKRGDRGGDEQADRRNQANRTKGNHSSKRGRRPRKSKR